MSGGRPSQIASAQKNERGTEKCIAIVYQGENAVQKIREVLGPTDPSKAPPGSIRREFGQTIMVNAAHASDSPENAQREMKIVQICEYNLKQLIEATHAALTSFQIQIENRPTQLLTLHTSHTLLA